MQDALSLVTYDVEREFDGFKTVYLHTPDWAVAVESAEYEVKNNTASYYAKTRIRNDGVILQEFTAPPKFTGYKGD